MRLLDDLGFRLGFDFDVENAGAGLLHGIGQVCEMIDQRTVIGALPVRLVDVRDDRLDGPRRSLESIEPRRFETNLVIVDTANEAVECTRNRDTAFDVGHVRAAVQRMTGTVQLVGDGIRRAVAVAGGEVVRDDPEVSGRLFRKDVEQHRIHLECRRLFGRFARGDGPRNLEHRGIRVALRERVSSCYQ